MSRRPAYWSRSRGGRIRGGDERQTRRRAVREGELLTGRFKHGLCARAGRTTDTVQQETRSNSRQVIQRPAAVQPGEHAGKRIAKDFEVTAAVAAILRLPTIAASVLPGGATVTVSAIAGLYPNDPTLSSPEITNFGLAKRAPRRPPSSPP